MLHQQESLFSDDEGGKGAIVWRGERAHARHQLKHFVPRSGKVYAAERNYDLGPDKRSNISCLSPYIRHRLITEQEVLEATLSRHSFAKAEKFVQEIFWRGYFKGWLEQHPSVWLDYQTKVTAQLNELDRSSDTLADYEQAISGKTGIACFDHWAVELVETGYLHNHARMWFASIWIFTLRLPWQLGADFFYRHLLDGDPASNTLSWRWVAGLHTKGKHYLARADNIEKFTKGRFAHADLNEAAHPLSEDIDHATIALNLPTFAAQNHDLESGAFGLLITEEDCHPESLLGSHFGSSKPKSVLAIPASENRSPLGTAERAIAFAHDAIDDATTRAEAHFECNSANADNEDLAHAVIDWAKSEALTHIVVAHLPLGPMRDRLNKIRGEVAAANIELVEIVRPYDRAVWPHATKGFFKLKQKIPHIISDLGL